MATNLDEAMTPGSSEQPVQKERGRWRRRIFRVLFVVSLLLNIILVGLLAERRKARFEEVFVEGNEAVQEKIVVIPVRGLIGAGLASQVDKMMKQLEEDPNVHGLVLRIDSPGGTVTATARAHHAMRRFIEHKREGSTAAFPVVASIEGIGASGAYYIATVADEIVVEPAALTGSIGVRLTLVNVSELAKRVGVEVRDVKTGPFKDSGSPFRPVRPEEEERFQELVQHYMQLFVDAVREGRGTRLREAMMDKITSGDVFVADEALQLGLADQVGYFEDAVARARELSGLEQVKVVELKKRWSIEDLFQLRFTRPMGAWSWLLPHEDPGVAVPQFYYLYGDFLPVAANR